MFLEGFKKGKPCLIDAVSIGKDISGRDSYLHRPAALAWLELRADARSDGVIIEHTTAFRTNEHQTRLWRDYLSAVNPYHAESGDEPGEPGFYDRYRGWCRRHKIKPHPIVAKPGHSNHQSGVAVDPVTERDKKVYLWLEKNAAKYGFVRTVPTERWHWEFRPLRVVS